MAKISTNAFGGVAEKANYRVEIFFAFETSFEYRCRKFVPAAKDFAEDESVFPIPTKNFGKAGKAAGRIASEKQHLVFRADSFGVVRMSAKPWRASHPSGVPDVKALRGSMTNFFVTFRYGATSQGDAVAFENEHAASE